ncbi:MAG TPA: aminotransferase class V-fold PLP-dependent enzyme [Cyclobacteriaceae bacterium]|nr:aminotransferase class V-fold PLP-dependent enzyme [Cyclobacteriaceae bacterium]
MNTRREFIKKAVVGAGSFSFIHLTNSAFAKELEKRIAKNDIGNFGETATDEDFWAWVRESFTVSPNIINLNNGGVSPQPKVVQDAHIRYYQLCNEGPSYYMWRTLDMGREPLREKLAQAAGCSPDEIAINRNSTEGLNTVIFGLNLKAGDEVVLSKYDYPNMMNAWKQREKRDKIKLVWIDIPQPLEDDQKIVDLYRKAITPATRVVHITHMINWTGNIVPAAAISYMAKEKGCEVIIDGAHTFGHTDFKIPGLGCDYFATSLHKWICAPFGSGMLYIQKNKIKDVWALLSSAEPDGNNIRKFETLGTRSFASEMAIGTAIDFHLTIGAKRKEERLRYLKEYWTSKIIKEPKFRFYSSLDPKYSCAIATVGIEGWEAGDIETKLFEMKRIHTVAIKYEKVNGIRITPHIYTTTANLDKLVDGLLAISRLDPPKSS